MFFCHKTIAALEEELELARHSSQKNLEGILKAIPAGFVITRRSNSEILFLNQEYADLYEYSYESLLGKNAAAIVLRNPQDREAMLATLNKNGFLHKYEMVAVNSSGKKMAVWVSMRPIIYHGIDALLSIVLDITADKKIAEEKIQYQAHHDGVTGLPNRTYFLEHLHKRIHTLPNKSFALIILDLDRFEESINLELGQTHGQWFLKVAAKRLKKIMFTRDLVAIHYGDQYAILVEDLKNIEELSTKIISKIEKAFERLIFNPKTRKKDMLLSVSMGVSIFPQHAKTLDGLLQCSQTALTHAKALSRYDNTSAIYEASMDQKNPSAIKIADLRQAERNGFKDFKVFYQPKINRENQMHSVEALIRWIHPQRGMVPPDQFIALAEKTGHIVKMTYWILQQACLQITAWRAAHFTVQNIAVNIPSMMFQEEDLLSQIHKIFEETQCERAWIEFEITETQKMKDDEKTVETLKALNRSGIKFALDDFGTGAASITYLRKYPFNTLKIDKSHVDGIPCDPQSENLVDAIIAMAQKFHLKTVAEGVENKTQSDWLRDHGCDELQGYFFSKPVPVEELQKGKFL